MPDKEGSEDNKSTKSVVNKKQKQMMGEEGYDIARDMGKVSPSKDKKDATTMPVSDEVKKTQKKSKGKSAVELVKASYGKSVMNVGKKKANEELDLSKVAEAFGGYIVEGKVEDEKKKADAKFKKDFAGSLKRNVATQKALPLYKAGGPFVPDKTIDLDTGKKIEPMERKPYFGKPSDPKNPEDRGSIPDSTERYERRQRRKEKIPADTGAGDPKEVKKTKKKFSDVSKKIQSLKKDQGKAKQGIVDVETDKFFKDVEKRKQTGFDNLKKAIKTGTTKSGEDASKIDREGTRDISTMNPSERERVFGSSGSTEGGAGSEGPKNQSGVVKFSSGARGKFDSGSAEMGGESGKFSNRKRGDSGSIPFKQLMKKSDNVRNAEVVKSTPFDNQQIEPTKPKREKPSITRGKARKDKGFDSPQGKSVFSKSIEKVNDFAKKNTAGALASYDIGKGILGKIYKKVSGIVNVPTPRAIRVSAKS